MKIKKIEFTKNQIGTGNREEYFQEEIRFTKTINELESVSSSDVNRFKEARKITKIQDDIKKEEEAAKMTRKEIFLEKTQEINLNEIDEYQKRQCITNAFKNERKKELKKRYIAIRNKSILG